MESERVVDSDLTTDMPVVEEIEVGTTVEKQRNIMAMAVAAVECTYGATEDGVETVSKKPNFSSVCALPDEEKTVHNSEKRYISKATLVHELMFEYQR